MTLKTSFWGSIRENMKRRIGINICIILFFVMSHPIATLLSLSNVEYANWNTAAEKMERIRLALSGIVGYNQGYAIAIMGIAVICAVQGFSYMYHKKKVDMYESLPITKTRRFAIIQLSGILSFAGIYLINGILSLLVGIGFHATTWEAVQVFAVSYLIYLLLYISVFEFTTIAVMLSGNIIVSILAVGALGIYEVGIQGLLSFFKGSFFTTYSSYSESNMLSTIKLSPFFLLSTITQKNIQNIDNVTQFLQIGGYKILALVVLSVLYLGVGYVLYKIRPNEATERAIAFPKTKTAIKVLLMIPLSLLIGILFYEISYNQIGFLLFGIILGTFLTHAFFQAVFEYDFKAILKNWKCFFYVIPVIAIILFIFMGDILGYDKYVPEANKVKSVAIILQDGTDQTYFGYSNGNYGPEKIRLDKMELTGENIETVIGIAKEVNNKEITANDMFATVLYKMNNGKKVYRSIRIDYNKQQDALNTLYKNEEYIDSSIFIDADIIDAIDYSNGIDHSAIEKEELNSIVSAYKADIQNATISEKSEIPVGIINFSLKDAFYTNLWRKDLLETTTLIIYPSYQNTIALLKGLHVEIETKVLPSEIGYITVTDNSKINYDNNNYQQFSSDAISETYTDQEDIKKIVEAMIPAELIQYVGWQSSFEQYYQIDIFVVPKKGIDRYQELIDARFMLLENIIPEL